MAEWAALQQGVALTHMILNTEDLLVILALNEERTLEGAARSLGKDSSSVFRAIKRIEGRLGRALFSRSHAGFSSLPGIEPLLHSARLISSELSAANQSLENAQGVASGRLKITTTDLFLHQFIAPRLSLFNRQHPEITLSFDTQNDVTQLWQRNFDLAIRPSNSPPEQMIGRQLLQLSHRVVAHPELFDDKGLSPSARWLLPGGDIANHPTNKWLVPQLAQGALLTHYDSFLQIYTAAQQGQGAACLPDFNGFGTACDGSGMRLVDGFEPCCEIAIWALYHPVNRYSLKIRLFVDFLQQQAQRVSIA